MVSAAVFVDEPWPDPDEELSLQQLPDQARFERPNVYEFMLDAPYDRLFVMARLPKDLRLFGRRREPIEHWDSIEASFYPNGLVEFLLACHGRTMDGYEKTERHHVGTFTAGALLADDHPARRVAPLLVSLGVGERTGQAAEQMAWAVFYHLLLLPNDGQLRWLLPDGHWLTVQMDAIQAEARAVALPRRRRRWLRPFGSRRDTATA
jgi:hypothetical protein